MLIIEPSAVDNGIAELKKKYQSWRVAFYPYISGRIRGGYSEAQALPIRKGGPIDPSPDGTYEKIVGESYSGYQRIVSTAVSSTKLHFEGHRMELVDDARKLSSGTPMENLYACYANNMKAC